MKNIVIILFITGLLSSCGDNRQNWLKGYQQAKCLWTNTEAALGKDTLQSTEKLQQQLTEIKTEIEKVQAPFQNKIYEVEKSIKQTKQKYFNQYRLITDTHNQVYGHKSTPEYEKRIKTNENRKNTEVAALQSKIDAIKKELENNNDNKELNEKFKIIMIEIDKAKNISKQKFKPTFDSLQTVIDNSNEQFKIMMLDLKEPEKQNFINQRDSIRANPCKTINE